MTSDDEFFKAVREEVEKEPEPEPEIRYLGDLKKLTLGPNDIVVLSTEEDWSMELVDRTRETMNRFFPNNKLVILTGGVKVGILTETPPPALPSNLPRKRS